MPLPARMRFGIFMAPFHWLSENPTLPLERDMELLEWLDHLGFDDLAALRTKAIDRAQADYSERR